MVSESVQSMWSLKDSESIKPTPFSWHMFGYDTI